MASTVSGKGIDHYKWHRLLSEKASTVKNGIACLRKGKLRRRRGFLNSLMARPESCVSLAVKFELISVEFTSLIIAVFRIISVEYT